MVDIIRSMYNSKGYAFFTEGAFNLNLFGVRRTQDVNAFNDVLGCAYRATPTAPLTVELWPGTTDPGLYYLRNPMRKAGTAIVVPGQYRGLWKLGRHKGDPAFVQVGPVTVWRDADRDWVLGTAGPTETGLFGINGHKAGEDSKVVERWSAGCQVWKRSRDHERALELGRAQVDAHPTWTKFTYTVFDEAPDAVFETVG